MPDSRPRVALMFAGHLRNWEATWPAHYKHVVQPWQADVFVHTWDDPGGSRRDKLKALYGPEPTHVGALDTNAVTRVIKPKAIVVENNLQAIKHKLKMNYGGVVYLLSRQADILHILSQLYSIQAVSQLRQEYERRLNIRYDYAIRVRIDWEPFGPITSQMLEATSGHKTLAVPTARHANHGHETCSICLKARHEGTHNREVCDMFTYGRADASDYACALYSAVGAVYASAIKELSPNAAQFVPLPAEGPFEQRRIVPAKPYQWRLSTPTFNPERLLMHHLAGYQLVESVWAGKVHGR